MQSLLHLFLSSLTHTHIYSYMEDLISEMFNGGLSETLTTSLKTLGQYIPAIMPDVQEILLNYLVLFCFFFSCVVAGVNFWFSVFFCALRFISCFLSFCVFFSFPFRLDSNFIFCCLRNCTGFPSWLPTFQRQRHYHIPTQAHLLHIKQHTRDPRKIELT